MGTPETKVYRGPMREIRLTRDIEQCEMFWPLESNEGLDAILAKQISLASRRQEDTVTVVDIGSGMGGLINNVVDDLQVNLSRTSVLPQSATALSQNPDIRLRMIGLTDARSENEFSRRVASDTGNPQVSGTNVLYSLTKDQTFADFLKSQDISKIHLALGTWSFAYFHPFLFRDTIRTTIHSLTPQGELVVGVYNNVRADSLSIYSGKTHALKEVGSIEGFKRYAEEAYEDPSFISADELIEAYEVLLKKFEPVHKLTHDSWYRDRRSSTRIDASDLIDAANEIINIIEGVKIYEINRAKAKELQNLETLFENDAVFTVQEEAFRVVKV